MIEHLQLLRNIGQFDSVATGARLRLTALTLAYAENGRGKTTLAAVLRSLRTGDPIPVVVRQRLTASHAPHIVLTTDGGITAVFQNGGWSATLPDIVVFDDLFVTENVCSGVDVSAEHRQNLHELILGAQGVALNSALQRLIAQIEEHNRALRSKEAAIPEAVRGSLTVDAFCALESRTDIDDAIMDAERTLSAARSADAVRQEPKFDLINLPRFDIVAIESLLQSNLTDLDSAAAARVQTHLLRLGQGGETWIADGMRRIAVSSAGHDHEICPFCAQALSGSSLIAHYRAYFSAAYEDLKKAISIELDSVRTSHRGEISAAFERAIRVLIQRRHFWARFADVPDIHFDTAVVARAWKAALETVVVELEAKQGAPLERRTLSEDVRATITTYYNLCDEIAALNVNLQAANDQIAIVKERTAAADITSLTIDLARLNAVKARHRPEVASRCAEYLSEKTAKATTEQLRERAREALDQYRGTVFPAYEVAINTYLQRFNAGFRLGRVSPANTRSGPTCTYSVLINNVSVPVASSSNAGPSFRNTLSSGDRNTLALAFFFASLDQDPRRRQKIVVIDDPITSLDEHRSLTTVQEMRRLVGSVEQLIVLSHAKSFLCAIWEGADTNIRGAIKIERDGTGSTLVAWDVNQDCITEHDRRHALVRNYMQASIAADERSVAPALRPILEAFVRVAYPEWFPPGSLLGPFLGMCRQRMGTSGQILAQSEITELRDLLDYANKFHHDTNPAWETATINDSELNYFCHRTLAFTRHR